MTFRSLMRIPQKYVVTLEPTAIISTARAAISIQSTATASLTWIFGASVIAATQIAIDTGNASLFQSLMGNPPFLAEVPKSLLPPRDNGNRDVVFGRTAAGEEVPFAYERFDEG